MRRDLFYLEEVLLAAQDAIRYAKIFSGDTLVTDRDAQRLLRSDVSEMGESVRRLSAELREMNPHIPWREMVDLRNFVVHEYHRVDYRVLRNSCLRELPDVCEAIVLLLERAPE